MTILELRLKDYDYFPNGLEEVSDTHIGFFSSIKNAENEIESLCKHPVTPKRKITGYSDFYNIGATKTFYLKEIKVK